MLFLPQCSIACPPTMDATRTHVNKVSANQTSSATVYSVSTNKTLYVTTLIISAYNAHVTNAGDLRIRDGDDNGTEKLPFLMAPAGLGAVVAKTPLQSAVLQFTEPLQFTSTVRVDVVSGTLTYSIGFVGYEE